MDKWLTSALDSGASGPDSIFGRGHCVVFLGKTFYSHPGKLVRTANFLRGGKLHAEDAKSKF